MNHTIYVYQAMLIRSLLYTLELQGRYSFKEKEISW